MKSIIEEARSFAGINLSEEAKLEISQEDINNIDMVKLTMHVGKLIGYTPQFTDFKSEDVRNDQYLYSFSEDISSEAGVFKAILKKLILKVTLTPLQGEDGVVLAGDVQYNYDWKNSGSNGNQLIRVWWSTKEKKWTFAEIGK